MFSSVKAEPGREYLWLRKEPCARNLTLSWARIAAAALALADAEGFEAVSMRRVAEELGAGTMTLYHYVANKDELVTLMVDTVMGEVLIPPHQLPEDWRAAMARIATSTRDALRRHHWMIDRLGDSRPGPNGLRHLEQSLQAMSGAALSPRATFEAVVLVDEYVFGFAIRESQERDALQRGWTPGVAEFYQRELDSGELSRARELLGDDIESARSAISEVFFEDGRFQRGLHRLLQGIEAGLASDDSGLR